MVSNFFKEIWLYYSTISGLVMNLIFITVTLVALVLSIWTIPGLPFDLFQEADATKSAGNDEPGRLAPKSYGSVNNKIVCGDRLCSELSSWDVNPQVRPIIFSEQHVTKQVTKELSNPIDLSKQHVTK